MSINNLPQLAPGALEPSVDLITVYHQKTGEEMKLQLSAVSAIPSGVSGAIQFSNGSAFASDAANLFWDDTNNRLGVGTNTPTAIIQAQNATTGLLLARFKDAFASTSFIDIKQDSTLTDYTGLYWSNEYRILSRAGGTTFLNVSNNVVFADGYLSKTTITPTEVRIGSISGARLGIQGSGSTSATTSLLVQNSAGTAAFRITDELVSTFFGARTSITSTICQIQSSAYLSIQAGGSDIFIGSTTARFSNKIIVGNGVSDAVASAQFQIDSTTCGFLPPRMTTTQKNAIATPASGLILYDSTTNKLQCYNGSTWNDLF